MATNSPVQVGQLWTSVQAGEFSGSIQNLGNFPLVGFVVDTIGTPPDDGAGGFSIPSYPVPIEIGATQELWVRAVCGINQYSHVILA